MKLDKSKRTILGMLCLYVAIGIVAIILFYIFGSKASRSGDGNVSYNFLDDGSAGSSVEVAGVTVIGDSGPLDVYEEEPEPEPEPEAVTEEPVEEPEPLPTKQFYSFVVTTNINRLHVRLEPNMQSKILNYFDKGKEGYVLEPGDEWSLVTDGKITGYCSNAYLNMTEISVDDLPDYFPEEYK